MVSNTILKEVSKFQCHYCLNDVSKDFHTIKDEWDQEFHYKVIRSEEHTSELQSH